MQVEFGAHQAILVRSEAAKEHLPPPLNRDSGLVLTVPQAKGLEFDDVFIVNFWSGAWQSRKGRMLQRFFIAEELDVDQGSNGVPRSWRRPSQSPAPPHPAPPCPTLPVTPRYALL